MKSYPSAGEEKRRQRFHARMGLIGRIIAIAVGFVVLVAAVGAYAYATDAGAEATVTGKRASGSTSTLELTLSLVPYTLEQDVSRQVYCSVAVGNFVVYHVQSAHTLLYEKKGGRLLYDSEKGLQVPPAPTCV